MGLPERETPDGTTVALIVIASAAASLEFAASRKGAMS